MKDYEMERSKEVLQWMLHVYSFDLNDCLVLDRKDF